MSDVDEPKASLQYLRRLALDTVRRTPKASERKAYLDAPISTAAQRLQKSAEAMRVWLEEELYFFLLLDNFRPRTKSVQSIPDRLSKAEITVRDAVAEIMLSTGFSLRNPGNDTFVTVVLEQCLGLTVQDRKVAPILAAGKKMYDGKRVKFLGTKGGSQSDLIQIVLSQRGFAEHVLDRHHRRLFGAPMVAKRADRKLVATIVDRVHAKPAQFFDVLAEWVTSERYLAGLAAKKPVTDRQFVRSLYTDLLERTPSYQEMRNMRNALQSMADPTPLRTVMAKVILDSGRARIPTHDRSQPHSFVEKCFERYLCRKPTQHELAKFSELLRDPAVQPRHVVRALVGSGEYQYY